MKQLIINLPDEVVVYEHDIRRFVDAMVHKLRRNAKKGRWEDLTAEGAFDLMSTEMGELEKAMTEGNVVEVLLESADVANFGLILSAIAIERGK